MAQPSYSGGHEESSHNRCEEIIKACFQIISNVSKYLLGSLVNLEVEPS